MNSGIISMIIGLLVLIGILIWAIHESKKLPQKK